MLWSLVKNTQWEPLLGLLSPAFFDVVPAGMLLSELRGLTSRYLSRSAYRSACTARGHALEERGLPFDIVGVLPKHEGIVDPRVRGGDVLALYFHQILGEGPVLLDMRSTTIARSENHWAWKPEPAIAEWPADFREGCRALYEGFYQDDATRFTQGARALGLGKAEAELRAQFGDTRAVTFSLREFQERFHQVFMRCKETRSKLHPGFLTLGLGLATLYEHLETIGAPLDVRAAFERVRNGAFDAATPAASRSC